MRQREFRVKIHCGIKMNVFKKNMTMMGMKQTFQNKVCTVQKHTEVDTVENS